MEPVSPIATSATKVGIEPLSRNFSPPSRERLERQSLDPAVSVELSGSAAKAEEAAEQRRYVRDVESQSLVYQVTDPVSGDIIVQIPDEIVIKARAYARQPEAAVGERVEKTV